MSPGPATASVPPAPPAIETPELDPLLGRELRLSETARALAGLVRRLAPRRVATLHVTCSDESERECAEVFQNLVVRELSGSNPGRRTPMRTANLGARYEWGCGPVALSHFRVPGDEDVLCLAKINAHVGVQRRLGEPPVYGMLDRPEATSTDCGALAAVMGGGVGDFCDELRLLLSSEQVDRTSLLRDPRVVATEHRALVAAAVSARLQARQAMLDLLSAPDGPDRLLVPTCVTLNQPGRDHEVLVGWYAAVRGDHGLRVTWTGLEDDPRRIAVVHGGRGVRLAPREGPDQEVATDERPETLASFAEPPPRRSARGPVEHRDLPGALWDARPHDKPTAPAELLAALGHAVAELEDRVDDPARPAEALALRAALLALGEALAVPAVLTFFAGGALDLHHAWRLQRIATGETGEAEARAILHEVWSHAECMDPATMQRTLRELQRLHS